MKSSHKVSKFQIVEACAEFLSPKGYRIVLEMNSATDNPRKELIVSSKFSGFQDNQIVGDRIMFVVKVAGRQDFETKSITEAIEMYNSF